MQLAHGRFVGDFEMPQRLTITQYGMAIARVVALRSTCPRRAVGAVLMKDGRIISTGYNGAPPGMRSCIEPITRPGDVESVPSGCVMFEGHCINTIHGEQNALLRAREVGNILISTDQPCLGCLKAALAHNPQIKIVYMRSYPDEARDLFTQYHNITMERISDASLVHIKEFFDNA